MKKIQYVFLISGISEYILICCQKREYILIFVTESKLNQNIQNLYTIRHRAGQSGRFVLGSFEFWSFVVYEFQFHLDIIKV